MKHLTIALLLGAALTSGCGKDKKPAAADPAAAAPAATDPAAADPNKAAADQKAEPKADDKPAAGGGGW